jgi:putative NIF3 family GTP cyclohydrolase 1 type 2
VRLDELVAELDAYFRVPDVRGDTRWSEFWDARGATYWREFVEPEYPERHDGLMVRGDETVERAATCVFPSDTIVASLEPRTFLFSEHPVDLLDEPGFQPLARESFERMRELGISFYHVHGPLDQHPEISPSRLIAQALGLRNLQEFAPFVEGIPGGAVVSGESDVTLDELARRLGEYLGPEIPVEVVARHRDEAGHVAVAAGGGADAPFLEQAIERGCHTYVTGNAATRCRLEFVQESVGAFKARAEEARVSVIDATHYGTEKPPQLAMVEWFTRRGLPAEFLPDGPK